MLLLEKFKEKIECFLGERHPSPKSTRKVCGYYRIIDTTDYNLYERPRGADKIVAAYGTMLLVQNHRNKNKLTIYPYYQNKSIQHKIELKEKRFPHLIPGSTVLLCMFLPYMRNVGENQYQKATRLLVITDKSQIYHNYPSRDKKIDGFSLPGDMLRFEESVVWDMPGRKYPVTHITESEIERYYPNLPEECYQYHPILNCDSEFQDIFGNGGFGNQTKVDSNGNKVLVSRFYIHSRDEQSNPFHFIGTGEKEYKMNLLATYRSNVDTGVRTCIFASSDGGRQWYCKYEFADLGEYDFRQGNKEAYGRNFGNKILNDRYDIAYKGGLLINKRNIVVPSEVDKEPKIKIKWSLVGKVKAVENSRQVVLETQETHGLSTGNIIALTGKLPRDTKMSWMLNSNVDINSAGNGLLFKVEVLDEYRISLYELVSSPENNIPCRHIHHINRIKDGWLFGTGEIYPNGWLFYLQMKKSDTFSIVSASDEFPIIRLNSTKDSAQRTMGMLLNDSDIPSFIYASDHDELSRKTYTICEGRTEKFSRNSTGIFEGKLIDIDDRMKHHVIFESTEPCFYFQKLNSMLIFCGQRGELGISFDYGKTWKRERIKAPIIYYYGSNGQYYYFDSCILVKKY